MHKPVARAAFARPEKNLCTVLQNLWDSKRKSRFPAQPLSTSFTRDGLANVKINRQPLENLRKTATPRLPHTAIDSSCRNWFWVSQKLVNLSFSCSFLMHMFFSFDLYQMVSNHLYLMVNDEFLIEMLV